MKTAERSRNFRPAAIIVQYDVTIFYRSETISEAKDLGFPSATSSLVGQEVDDLLHSLRGGLRLLGVANLR